MFIAPLSRNLNSETQHDKNHCSQCRLRARVVSTFRVFSSVLISTPFLIYIPSLSRSRSNADPIPIPSRSISRPEPIPTRSCRELFNCSAIKARGHLLVDSPKCTGTLPRVFSRSKWLLRMAILFSLVNIIMYVAAMPLKVEPEDWQNSRGVLASNRYMLDNQIECDVQFVICTPDGARVFIPAHSYVLISRSPVFHAMLNGPLAENKKEIRICDVTPEAFNHLLGCVIKCLLFSFHHRE